MVSLPTGVMVTVRFEASWEVARAWARVNCSGLYLEKPSDRGRRILDSGISLSLMSARGLPILKKRSVFGVTSVIWKLFVGSSFCREGMVILKR